MSKNRKQKMITPEIMRQAVVGAFTKLDPRYMMKNPVMFVVEIGLCDLRWCSPSSPGLFGRHGRRTLRVYNSHCVAPFCSLRCCLQTLPNQWRRGAGKAQAASLKKDTKGHTRRACLMRTAGERMVPSSELKKGDVVHGGPRARSSRATARSSRASPRWMNPPSPANPHRWCARAGGDFCSVTGGTTVVSDWLKIRITSDPGNSFLDRMIALVEGASRKKTPNEIALNTLLVSLTIIFLIVIVTTVSHRPVFRRAAPDFHPDRPDGLPDPHHHRRPAVRHRNRRAWTA